VPQNLAPASVPAYAPTRPPSKIQAIGIVITARNHCETIAKCIHSLFASNSRAGWHNSLWIVVVADACTDDTAKLAREALGAFGQVLEVSARSQQAAHQIGSATVIEHFRDVARHTVLLMSTDATAELPRDWIEAQLQCAGSPVALALDH
jgi:hypothetical protein